MKELDNSHLRQEPKLFKSGKRVEGFSVCFRQWRAEGTHCKFLHGYSIYFDLEFQGELDHRNWVVDFGFLKRSSNGVLLPGSNSEVSLKEWFEWWFDHTTLIASSDPLLPYFEELDFHGALKLRVLKEVGIELLAKFVFVIIEDWLKLEKDNSVQLLSVKCYEHEKNWASYP